MGLLSWLFKKTLAPVVLQNRCRRCGIREADHMTPYHGCTETERVGYHRRNWAMFAKPDPDCPRCKGTGIVPFVPQPVQVGNLVGWTASSTMVHCACKMEKAKQMQIPLREDDFPCSGVSVICEQCFKETTPEERLETYNKLLGTWSNPFQASECRRAVLAGK